MAGFPAAEARNQAQGEPVQFVFFSKSGDGHRYGDWWGEGGDVLGWARGGGGLGGAVRYWSEPQN
jgi:hypothetical protein